MAPRLKEQYDTEIKDQLKQWEDAGYGDLPVCMAKTQYSFSTDPKLLGAPENHVIKIREVRLDLFFAQAF